MDNLNLRGRMATQIIKMLDFEVDGKTWVVGNKGKRAFDCRQRCLGFLAANDMPLEFGALQNDDIEVFNTFLQKNCRLVISFAQNNSGAWTPNGAFVALKEEIMEKDYTMAIPMEFGKDALRRAICKSIPDKFLRINPRTLKRDGRR